MLNKRGIGHLIAVILMVALTVTFAAIVMTWGRDFMKTTQETGGEKAQKHISCEFDIKLGITDVNLTNNTIRLQIENAGTGDIDKFSLRIYGFNETDEIETAAGLEPLGIQTLEVIFDADKVGVVDKIEIIPLLKGSNNEYTSCSNKKIVYKVI